MAVTVTDNRTIPSNGGSSADADSTTNWTGGTITLVTADPDPIEATGHLGNVVSTATVDCYFTGTSTSMTGKLLYGWALPLGAMDTLVNGGVALLLGDGTNRVGYHLAGSDTAVFRHNTGQPTYQCLLLDQSSLPTNRTTRAGSEVSLNFGAITQMGVMFKTLAKSKGGTANCYVDIIRILDPSANNGCALTISGGTEGGPGTFTEIATEDSSIADVKAHGIARLLGAGAIGLQGPLRFGDQASASSWFEDKNVTVVFEDRGLAASRYKIVITDNGTGTTTFILGTIVGTGISATGADGVTITGGPAVNWQFDASTDTDVTDVFIYGSTFNRATQGISFRSGHKFIGGVISSSGTITLNGATFVNNSVVNPTVSANTSALVWDVATDPDTFLHGTSISKGTAAHHAIEFGTTSLTEMTLRNMTFTGFSATEGGTTGDETLHIKRTTGNVIINLVGCSGNIGYRTEGATVSLVANPVTTTITVTNIDTGLAISGARVLVTASNNTGPMPFEEVVTIARSNTTASVAHTGHGLISGKQVQIKGASQMDYNGVWTIQNVTTNAYDYLLPDTGAAALTINVNAPAGTFTRTTGDYLTDGLRAGNTITTSGFGGGNDVVKVIASVTATVITVTDNSGLTTAGGNNDERVQNTPTTPATTATTIKATGVVIDGLTNASGVISDTRTHASSQPITGRVRKATGGTFYKTGAISGTINSASGFAVTVQMIPD